MAQRDAIFNRLLEDSKAENKKWCDFTVVAKDREFPVHKLIMAVSSEYFDAMFSNNVKETNENKVIIPDLSADVVEEMIGFCYGLKVDINTDNLWHWLQLGERFQMPDLMRLCCDFIYDNWSPANSVTLLAVLDKFKLNHHEKEAFAGCYKWFSEIIREDIFKSLSEEMLSRLISYPVLDITDESVVISAIMNWISGDVPNRAPRVESLLQVGIRPELLDKQLLEEIESNQAFVSLSPKCRYFIHSNKEQILLREEAILPSRNYIFRPFIQRSRYDVKLYDDFIATVRLNEQRQFTLFEPRTKRFTKVQTPAQIGSLYTIIGGYIYTFKNGPSEVSCRYDIRRKIWLFDVAEQEFKRTNYHIVTLGDSVYAIGDYDGFSRSNRESRVHRYDAMENTWTEVRPMLHGPGAFISGVTAHRGKIYVMKDPNPEIYDPMVDAWSHGPPLLRRGHLSHRRHFITGGDYIFGFIKEHTRDTTITEVECVSPATNIWYTVKPCPHMFQINFGVVWFKDEIHLYDGFATVSLDWRTVAWNSVKKFADLVDFAQPE